MTEVVVVNRFRELLAIKSRRERRTISQREVAASTGLAKTTVDAYARNGVTRYDANVIKILCEYFECSIGDLLVLEEVAEDPETKTPLLQTA